MVNVLPEASTIPLASHNTGYNCFPELAAFAKEGITQLTLVKLDALAEDV